MGLLRLPLTLLDSCTLIGFRPSNVPDLAWSDLLESPSRSPMAAPVSLVRPRAAAATKLVLSVHRLTVSDCSCVDRFWPVPDFLGQLLPESGFVDVTNPSEMGKGGKAAAKAPIAESRARAYRPVGVTASPPQALAFLLGVMAFCR